MYCENDVYTERGTEEIVYRSQMNPTFVDSLLETVIFVPSMDGAPLTTLGPVLEHHEAFPGGVNVEFVEVLAQDRLRMRVWERGSGVTMACGTGACASVTAAVKKGYCKPDDLVAVELDGGTLKIRVAHDGEVTMTGPAEFVYEGDAEL